MIYIGLRSCRCLHFLLPSSSTRSSLAWRSLQSSRTKLLDPNRSRQWRIELKKDYGSAEDKRPSKSFKDLTYRDLAKIVTLAIPHRIRIFAGVVCLCVSSAIFLTVPRVLGKLIDEEDEAKREQAADNFVTKFARFFKENPAALIAVFILGAGAIGLRNYFMHTAGQLIVNDLRTKVFNTVLRQDMSFFDRNKVGEIVSRLSTDAYIVGYSVTSNLGEGMRALFTTLGSVAMMVYTSPDLSQMGGFLIPCIVLSFWFFGRLQKKYTMQMQEAVSSTNQLATERLSNVRTVRIFAAEEKELRAYKNKIAQIWDTSRREGMAKGIMFGGFQFTGYMAFTSILYYGSILIGQGVLTYGDLSSFMIYTVLCSSGISNTQGFYMELMRGLGASARLFELQAQKSLIPISGGLAINDLKRDIRFESIAFAYPDRSPIFNDVTFRIPAASVTAIVGPSGSGKSTIAHLLLRLYTPTQGRITVDDIDMRQLDPAQWRRMVGTVSQEPILFSTTIRDNILYGVENSELITEEILHEVAEQSNCLEFIQTFPHGFDTPLGEHGSSMLSGGQRQRIAIARALIKKPRILIMDEATSALDATSEYLVRKALEALLAKSGQTVLIIAHRLSTIKHANQIVVLDKGTVAELGTFDELMGLKDGIFYRLVEKQTFDWRDDKF